MSKRPSDPTRTATLRKYYVNEFNSRYRELNKLINKSIVVNDCLSLKSEVSFEVSKPYIPSTWKYQLEELHKRAYPFSSNVQKVAYFMDWLKSEEQKALFQIVYTEQFGEAINPVWQNIYLKEFYKKGVVWSRQQLNAAGLEPKIDSSYETAGEVITQEEHVDRLGSIYTRTYTDLVGVTATMDAQISAVLADGLREGLNPRVIANNLTNRVDKIGKYRSTLIARTESIRSHHLASMQEYKNAGVSGVKVQSEWSTANDGRVCRRCSPLDYDRTGKLWKIEEIEPLIPLHPQCRCAALPHVIRE